VESFNLNIVKTKSIDELARNDVLQVMLVATIFGVSSALVGDKAKQVGSLYRPGLDRSVQGHGPDRARGSARRAWRGCLHGRTLRGRLPQADDLAGRAVLRIGRDLRPGDPRRRDAACRTEHPQVPGVPARGTH